ncbi:MAG TPA: histidine kinase dimerization/phospho-acceptor domain-containing protein [Ramlibacter sp.]|nr:histidine kinase dimerization/phospho-acceptor domain-containing protein [Ramlibacter sp.]
MSAGGARPTLTRHLLAWALGALLLVWASFMVVGYKTGEHEADELTDGHLASVSSLLLPLAAGGLAPGRVVTPQAAAGELKAHDYQRSLSVVVWDAQGRLLSRSGDAPLPPFGSPDGFATLRLGEPAQAWRAFTRWDEARARRLMVLLSVEERDELAEDIAGQVVEPGLWLLPVVALVLGLAIHRGLRPLRRLAHDVHALDVQQPRGLRAPPHGELAATADAINRLVERYHAALTRERELANEFAHELRTPLASLQLQARTVQEAAPGPAQQAALARLREDAARAGEVLSHLLALARASRAELDEAAQPFDLDGLARRLVADHAPAAHAGGRDLGLASPGPFPVTGHPILLELALRNLVENALAHTPPGTEVEVTLDPVGRWLQVSDNGAAQAGDPPAAGGDDAVQPLRLGLGHRVVEKVAALHGGRFEPDLQLPGARRGWRIRLPEQA